jgi:hypothetical protein
MPEVPIRRTPVTAAQAEAMLSDSWSSLFSETVRPDVLRLMLALWDLETDAGRRMWNNNFGNILVNESSQNYYLARDGINVRRFRSWVLDTSGADGFVRQVTSPTRPIWSAGLMTGHPQKYAVALKGPPAYYEASVERYTKTLVARWNKYPHLHAAPPGRRSSGGGWLLVGMLAAYYALQGWAW